MDQKIPKPKRLQEWYKKMLDKAVSERIVHDYKVRLVFCFWMWINAFIAAKRASDSSIVPNGIKQGVWRSLECLKLNFINS